MRRRPVHWSWVCCTDHQCGHTRAIPFLPWIIRWGTDEPYDLIRRNFVCSKCGKKGAIFNAPSQDYRAGRFPDFPERFISIGGKRKSGESCNDAEARHKAEYLSRYPNGDALAAFRGGPPGVAQMCGKFTAMASWSEVVNFSQVLTGTDIQETDNDRPITFRVMSNLPVIIWDKDAGRRRVVPMRWGFPDPGNWRIPRPIHARAESIDSTKAFAKAMQDGQRGIVLVRNFNEAPDLPGKVEQHTITPGDSGAIGIAFVWRRFELTDLPGTLNACVMVTVPANTLIASLPTDRMPAVLANEDWSTWLGENNQPPEAAKACLKTVEGVRWTMTKEERESKEPRTKPTVSNPKGLF